ncbi:hypothetical protein UFOVP209_45 [uncultured Caudovirales phage]|uniref:Uncharacterized protein n=1 Tax=uncultured Caudovirales phage TaxID=2100421 RepID=A0A6J7WJQ7_9CAUD|nr:hypothetical protein UFOVP209_45 [uncultured Caudovirales phage]
MEFPNQLATIHLFDPVFSEAVVHDGNSGTQLVSLRFGSSFAIISHNVDKLLDELLATVDAVQNIIEDNEQLRPDDLPDRRDIYEEANALVRSFRDIAQESA